MVQRGTTCFYRMSLLQPSLSPPRRYSDQGIRKVNYSDQGIDIYMFPDQGIQRDMDNYFAVLFNFKFEAFYALVVDPYISMNWSGNPISL